MLFSVQRMRVEAIWVVVKAGEICYKHRCLTVIIARLIAVKRLKHKAFVSEVFNGSNVLETFDVTT